MAGSVNSQWFKQTNPGNRDYCYIELVISSPAAAMNITVSECDYAQEDCKAVSAKCKMSE